MEIEQQKAMVNHVSIVGGPFITSTISNPINVTTLSLDFLIVLWKLDTKGSIPWEFFELYVYQRYFFPYNEID